MSYTVKMLLGLVLRIFLVIVILFLVAQASLHPDSVVGCYKMLWAIFVMLILIRSHQIYEK